MRALQWVWPGAAAVLAVMGCGDGRVGGDSLLVRDSAGIRLVEIPGPISDTLRLELDPTWPAGELEDLGDLIDVDAGPDGILVLLDGFGAEVRVLDRSGRELTRFGGRGEGPGEFNPQGLSAVLSTDSSIIVPDLFQQRVSEFSYAGELIRTNRFPGEGGYALDWRTYPGGGLAFRLLQPTGDALLLWENEQVDTLFAFPRTTNDPNQILPPVALWDVHRSGLALATSDVWTVRLNEMDGDGPRWIARRAGDGQPLSDVELAALEELLVNSAAREAGGAVPTGAARAQLLSQVSFPSTGQALGGLRIGRNGEVWVQQVAPVRDLDREALRVGSAAGYGGPWWTVLESDGSMRSHVRLPDGFRVTRITDEWLFGILADEMGVERPARVAYP